MKDVYIYIYKCISRIMMHISREIMHTNLREKIKCTTIFLSKYFTNFINIVYRYVMYSIINASKMPLVISNLTILLFFNFFTTLSFLRKKYYAITLLQYINYAFCFFLLLFSHFRLFI